MKKFKKEPPASNPIDYKNYVKEKQRKTEESIKKLNRTIKKAKSRTK